MINTRTAAALFLTACIAGVLAACSSSSDGTPPPAPVTVTHTDTASSHPTSGHGSSAPTSSASSSSSASSASSSTATSSTSSSSADGGAVATCLESQLRASIDPRGVKGSDRDHDYAVIVDFENTSNTACTIHGYPGASLLNASNQQVKQATRTIRGRLLGLPTSVSTVPTVVLQPGAYASAGLEGVSTREAGAAQAGCDENFERVLVTPPNTSTAVPFTLKWPVCSTFTVHPTNIEKNPPA